MELKFTQLTKSKYFKEKPFHIAVSEAMKTFSIFNIGRAIPTEFVGSTGLAAIVYVPG